MIFLLVLSVVAPVLAAFAMFKWAFADFESSRSSSLLCATLAVGSGLGLSSCAFFLSRVAGSGPIAFRLMEIPFFLLLAGVFFVLNKRGANRQVAPACGEGNPGRRSGVFLFAAFYALLVAGIVAFVTFSVNQPHGIGDAQAMWNLRARCLFRSGEQWTDCFSPAAWCGSDYPLLVPGTIARLWGYLGFETVLVPVLVAAFFTFGTAGLTTSAFSVIGRRSQGLLAGISLLGTTALLKCGAAQYADVPLSFFMLSAVLILTLKDRMSPENGRLAAMAGLMSAMAAWTKNEGILFIVAVVVARSVLVLFSRRFKKYSRELFFLLAGALPVLAVVALFKLGYTGSNDVIGSRSLSGVVPRLLDMSRYVYIGTAFAKEMFFFANGLACFLLLYVLLGNRLGPGDAKGPAALSVFSVLATMLTGYALIYVVTPYDLAWHLQWSLDRLLLHVWPVFLVLLFLLSKPFPGARRQPTSIKPQAPAR